MDLKRAGVGLAGVSSTFRMAQFGLGAARFIAAVHTQSLAVFLRHDFGTRYASKMNLFFGIVMTGFYSGLGGWIISALHHESMSTVMGTLYTASICMAVWHRVAIWLKRRRGQIWHSRYSGTPHLERLLGFTGFSEQVIKQYFEPLFLFVLAYVASEFHESTVSTWLIIGGISIFCQETLDAQIAENDILDQQDALIEARYRRRAATGKATKQDQGYSIAQSSIELMRLVPKMAEQEAELSPEVRAMLDPVGVGK